ncbi:kelch-like protein 17 isoform X1 [Cebus imitator]|uniref:kelch-like protein 17 isoform X1 n=1 Tax=Cebus imitator TaxID=2715852 RepID=UPI001896C830|nr:kelch-like protein 17 isoform X1 [Cebus imitator]
MEGAVQLLSREGHSVAHNSKRHYHDAFVAMSRMRQRGLLCDIVLHVAAKEIRAHKVVLASCSPYFHAMFTNEMSESRQTHVTLHDIDPQALDQLVQFAYTAEIVVGEGNVQTLLPAASLLQLNGVRDACCKFLLSQLDPSNCLGIRGFADAHSCSDLLKAAHRYVLQHFVDVAKTEEFMLLPLKQVLELVSSDSLNVPSEEEVYRAVLSWVKHDVDARRQHVPRLMKCVRLPLLSRDFLLGHVDAESLVRHHPDCKDLLIEALKFHLLPEQRGVLGTSRTRPRRCEGAGPVLFAVGGGSLFAIHGDCEAYDTRTDRWHVVASMSTRRARVGVAAVGNRLYAVGGYDGTSDLATVESYDPVTNTWQPEVSMGTRRSCLGVAALHGLLYSAGGYDGASCLNSAERYDPLTGAWTSVAAMSTRRRYVRVATLDGNLYAVGGYDSSSHLATVEKYEPQEHTRPGGHGWLAVCGRGQRWQLQPQLHREVQPEGQQVGGRLLHVHAAKQCGRGGAGAAPLPAAVLAHALRVLHQPLTQPPPEARGLPHALRGPRPPPGTSRAVCRITRPFLFVCLVVYLRIY